jgi:hypothetical protein
MASSDARQLWYSARLSSLTGADSPSIEPPTAAILKHVIFATAFGDG